MSSIGMAMKKLKQDDDDSSTLVLLCEECQTDERCGILNGLATQVQVALEQDRQRLQFVNFTWLFDFVSGGEMVLATKPFEL